VEGPEGAFHVEQRERDPMSGHEVANPLVRRQNALSSRDDSRYYTLRLVVQRSQGPNCTVSLIFASAAGQKLGDTRLGVATIPWRDAAGHPLPAGALLRAALDAMGM
jgi:hypothetical protein